jgi:hypothetical protein
MLYIKLDQEGNPVKFPIMAEEVRKALSHMSLPATLTNEVLAGTGFQLLYMCDKSLMPRATLTHEVQMDTPAFVDGRWERRYKIVMCVPEARNNQRIKRAWDEVRKIRNTALFASDRIVLKGYGQATLGMTPDIDLVAWETYRQAMRDVTKQPDPYNVEFPVRPDAV